MLAFIREPVPPANIRKPVLPKPVNDDSSEEAEDDGEDFETKMKQLTARLYAQMDETTDLDEQIRRVITELGYGT